MKRRDCSIDQEADQDQDRARAAVVECIKGDRSIIPLHIQDDPAEQDDASCDMHHQVPKSRIDRCLSAPVPDKADRRPCQKLPEDEECEEIACKDDAKRTPNIYESDDVLPCFLYMQRIERHTECSDCKDVSEALGKEVNPSKNQIILYEMMNPVCAFLHVQKIEERQSGNCKKVQLFQTPRDERYQKSPYDEYGSRWHGYDIIYHSNPPLP